MRALQRTLAIVASLYLGVQTVRHAYVLWFEPRSSVLDRFDQPLRNEINAAGSLEELVRRYEPVRKDADRVKAERRAADPKTRFEIEEDVEPFRSERALRDAINGWEEKSKEIHALRFYWTVGCAIAIVGMLSAVYLNRWLGLTLLIVGFAELVYWTSPTFLGPSTREFDRLLVNKLALSAVSVVLLVVAIRILGVFNDADA